MSGRNGVSLSRGRPNYGTQELDHRSPKKDTIPYRFMSYCLCILLTAGVFAAAVYISFKYSSVGSSSEPSGIWYSPNDSHLVPVSGTFCQSLHVSPDRDTYGFNISLSMLDTTPGLTDRDHFSFSNDPTFGNDDLIQYYYYLYEGSTINISSCLIRSDGSRILFYLIRSNKTYQNVKQKIPHINPYLAQNWSEVTYYCRSGRTNNIVYSVTKSDYYYVLFVDQKDTWTSNSLNVTMSLSRTKYGFEPHTSDHCESDATSPEELCSVTVPLSGHTALLTLKPNQYFSDVDWALYKVLLTTKCSPRVWMYTFLSLAVSLGIVVFILLSILFCIAATKCHKRRVHHPALLNHISPSHSTSDLQSDSVSLQSAKFSPIK